MAKSGLRQVPLAVVSDKRPALRLISFAPCKQTLSVLRHLLQQVIRGEVRGLSLCTWNVNGTSTVWLTGACLSQPERALAAAEQIKVQACHQLDLL